MRTIRLVYPSSNNFDSLNEMAISIDELINEDSGGIGGGGGINLPVSITTLSLPIGSVGSQYNESLSASDGYPPYSWDLTAGSLPRS